MVNVAPPSPCVIDARLLEGDESGVTYIPASAYSFRQLADLYNRTRMDYIVPMPMNARRMEEYVALYDVCLNASLIALDPNGEEAGIAMLGLRGDRAWVTRLGIIPEKRRFRIGRRLTTLLLDCARACGAQRAQLEVIDGNEAAYPLFESLGFRPTRMLLVLRRSPESLPPMDAAVTVEALDDAAIDRCLDARTDHPTWIEEHASWRRAGGVLHGWRLTADGETGWLVARTTEKTIAGYSSREITHAVFGSPQPAMTRLLLHTLHTCLPDADTKIENLPADHPHWVAFRDLGYAIAFQRIEMLMRL